VLCVLSGRGLCDELITRPEVHWGLSHQKQKNKKKTEKTETCNRKRNKQITVEKNAERERQEIIKQHEIADSDLQGE
jgi:hypothetical protein